MESLTPHSFYFFGFGGLLSRPPPEGLVVVLGFPALPFDIIKRFIVMPLFLRFGIRSLGFKWTSGLTTKYIAIEILHTFPS